jgi:hypothetical protein
VYIYCAVCLKGEDSKALRVKNVKTKEKIRRESISVIEI